MNRNPQDESSSEKNRRNFLKRLTSGLIGGSLFAGISRLSGQEKKGSAKNPGRTTGPMTVTDTTPLLGEVCLFPFNFAPAGWAQCNGQLLQISTNTALFSILGTTYGGDGRTTFGLPNLQGIVPIGAGTGTALTPRFLGETGGLQNATLDNTTIPSHSHGLSAKSGNGTSNNPQGNFFAANAEGMGQFNSSSDSSLNVNTLSETGGELAHNNMPPYLVLNLCIALQGVYPSRSTGTSPDQVFGDIILFAGNFVPAGYLACDGSLLSIAANDVLFNLIGTTFGGDGVSTFAVPDLQGRAPIHTSSSHIIGERSGMEAETLTINQIPPHIHQMHASSGVGDSVVPGNNYVAANLEGVPQFSGTADTVMNSRVVGADGGSNPHDNMPPYLAMTYCISNAGTFPSQ